MAALAPITENDAFSICSDISDSTGLICDVATINSPSQVVISGHSAAVEAAISLAKSTKGVRRATKLNVSNAFHSRLMQSAAERFRPHLESTKFQTQQCPLIANVTAREVASSEEIPLRLHEQMTKPVRWSECVMRCIEATAPTPETRNGKFELVEIGPKAVLTSLARQIVPQSNVISLDTADDVKKFLDRF